MNRNTSETNEPVLDVQREHWQTTFASRAEMFGTEPSYAARRAAVLFQRKGKRRILELGSGQGRDTLFFVQNGFEICAVDYSEKGLEDLRKKAERLGVGRVIQTVCHDVRRLLPFKANTFDACFSHMLYCMALTTADPEARAWAGSMEDAYFAATPEVDLSTSSAGSGGTNLML